MKFAIGLIFGLALGMTLPSIAQNPCGPTWGAWQVVPPRVGVPERIPLACIEIDGALRCQ